MDRQRKTMTPEELTLLTQQLVGLAKENADQNIKSVVHAAEFDAALEQMASKVIDQILNLKEEDRLIVCMATMTKLLVENWILQTVKKA